MVGKASCDGAACVSVCDFVCVCVILCLSERVSMWKREGGEKARQLEKVTLPVAQYVIPTGTGV